MKEIKTAELLLLQLDIMDSIHNFCKENNLRYFLYGGSLLGAIRHEGYIPWDDDIDIAMPRDSYEKFIRSFNGTYDYLVVSAPELDINFYATYANVYDTRTFLDEGTNGHQGADIGIKIDIFPIDSVEDDLAKYRFDKHKVAVLNNIAYIKRYRLFHGGGWWQDLKLLAYKLRYVLHSACSMRSQVLDIASKCSISETVYVDDIVQNYSHDTRFKRTAIDKLFLTKFEDRQYFIPTGYDEILKASYGDYMKLPPIEKRVPHHGFKAFWR